MWFVAAAAAVAGVAARPTDTAAASDGSKTPLLSSGLLERTLAEELACRDEDTREPIAFDARDE